MKRLTDEEVARITSAGRGAAIAGDSARYDALCGELQADYFRAREDRRLLAQMLRNFAETAEAAVKDHEWRMAGAKEMHAPFHGDFAGSPPSVIGRLRWWATEMRKLLAEVEP